MRTPADIAAELERAFKPMPPDDRADEGPCCAKCGCSVIIRGDDEWEEGWWCHGCNGEMVGRIRLSLPTILSALRTAAARKAKEFLRGKK